MISEDTTTLRTHQPLNTQGMTKKEKALAMLGRDCTDVIEAAKTIRTKIEKGEVLTEADRLAYRDATENFFDYLVTLMGEDPEDNTEYVDDCIRTQNTIDDFIREQVEGEELTAAQHLKLTGDEVETTTQRVVFSCHAHCYEKQTVEVVVPNVILEDGQLMEQLIDELNDEVRDNLEQDHTRSEWDGDNHETLIE